MRLDLASLPKRIARRFFMGLAYRQVWNTEQGRTVLADLLRFAGMDTDIFVPGDPHATAYNAGRRRVGLRIQAFLGFDEAAASKYLGRASTAVIEGDE